MTLLYIDGYATNDEESKFCWL